MSDDKNKPANVNATEMMPVLDQDASAVPPPVEDSVARKYENLFNRANLEIPPGGEKGSPEHQKYLRELDELRRTEIESNLTDAERTMIDSFRQKIDLMLNGVRENAAVGERKSKSEIAGTIEAGSHVDAATKAETAPIVEKKDPETIARLARGIRVVSDVERPENLELVPGDDAGNKRKIERKKEICGMIERRNWGGAINKLKNGDHVISVLNPGADFLKIKNLNDNILGYAGTSAILEYRNKLVAERLVKVAGEEAGIIKTDYQSSTIRIPEGKSIAPVDLLAKEMEVLDGLMTEHLVAGIQAEREKYKDNPKRLQGLDKFEKELTGKNDDGAKAASGYRMTFGIAVVEADSMGGKINALNQSTQAARTARGFEGSYGMEYSPKVVVDELRSIRDLRERLKDASITDIDGVVFKVFNVEKNGLLKLNRDVLRDVRKGKFKAAEGSMEIHDLVVQYVKKINIIDSVKPFVNEAAKEGGKLQKQIENYSDLTNAYLLTRDGSSDDALSEEEREIKKREEKRIEGEIREIVKTEEKDPNFTSADFFHAKATEIKNCAYLEIDVIDLGVDQLQEFDRLLQEAEHEAIARLGSEHDQKSNEDREKILDELRKEILDEKAAIAGDEATEKMLTVRKNIHEVLGKYNLLLDVKNDKYGKFGNEGLALGRVGGDEITLAVDIKRLKDNGITVEELMLEIREATNHGLSDVRITKTVAAAAIRDSEHTTKQSQEEIIAEHLATIKRSEAGAEIAKNIEEKVRKLNLMIEHGTSVDKIKDYIAAVGLEKIFNIDKSGLVKAVVIIIEKENGLFDVKARGLDTDKINAEDARALNEKIAELMIKITPSPNTVSHQS